MATPEVSDVLIAEVLGTKSRAEGLTQSLEEDSSSSTGQIVSGSLPQGSFPVRALCPFLRLQCGCFPFRSWGRGSKEVAGKGRDAEGLKKKMCPPQPPAEKGKERTIPTLVGQRWHFLSLGKRG